MRAHVFHSDNGGYGSASGNGFNHCYFRWHPSIRPSIHLVTTRKAAIDEGKPAELVRTFKAVTDDFGTLVEV